MTAKKLVWRRNIWTGHDTLDLSRTDRVVRQTYVRARPLYSAQYWGDFSLVYPVRGPWRGSLAAARRDLSVLRQAHGEGKGTTEGAGQVLPMESVERAGIDGTSGLSALDFAQPGEPAH